MHKEENRIRQLLARLTLQDRLTIHEARALLHVSEATLRRLFQRLEEEGKVIRVHGGIQYVAPATVDYSYRESEQQAMVEKQRIGELAARQIVDGMNVFFDSGTTVLQAAKALARRNRLDELKNLNVVTNSLVCVEILVGTCPVTMTGGVVRSARHDLCGLAAEQALARYHFDCAVIGADAITESGKLLTTDDLTAALDILAMAHSKKVFLLVDSTKFSRRAFVEYGRLDGRKITVISDAAISTAARKLIESSGANLLIAK